MTYKNSWHTEIQNLRMDFGKPKTKFRGVKTKDGAAVEMGENGKMNANHPCGLPPQPQTPFPAPALPPASGDPP